jgi:hypothetical protein
MKQIFPAATIVFFVLISIYLDNHGIFCLESFPMGEYLDSILSKLLES